MKTTTASIILFGASSLACGPRVLADGDVGGSDSGGDDTASDDDQDSASASGAAPPDPSTTVTSATTSPPEPDPPPPSSASADGGDVTAGAQPIAGIVGAAFLEDGLCPWNYDYSSEPVPALTLQITDASFACNMLMWNEILDRAENPAWFAELHLPFAAAGVYDLSEVPGFFNFNVVEADGGGGGAAGPLTSGVVEITYVDETIVIGTLTDLAFANLNGVDYDLNGTFEATRCTATAWLDASPGEPHEPPLPRACLNP